MTEGRGGLDARATPLEGRCILPCWNITIMIYTKIRAGRFLHKGARPV